MIIKMRNSVQYYNFGKTYVEQTPFTTTAAGKKILNEAKK